MIKKLAIVLLSSFLMVGSMGQTVEAAHGIPLINYCPGDYKPMGEPNISSWRYTHLEGEEGDRVKCYVYGWTERVWDYCSTCFDKKNPRVTHYERHENPLFEITVEVYR